MEKSYGGDIMSGENICPECGFDKTLTREPIILDSNVLSLASYFDEEENGGRCKTCGHWKSGYTIIGDNPIGRLNNEWKDKIHQLYKRFERDKQQAIVDWLKDEEKSARLEGDHISADTLKGRIAKLHQKYPDTHTLKEYDEHCEFCQDVNKKESG
jgi:hypothetical protein